MGPPLQEAASNPVETSVQDESSNTSKVLPHADPTFYQVASRLDWGVGDWILVGPSYEDGTRPTFKIEWRLGELIMRILMRHAKAKLSRSQRAQFEQGEPLERVRIVKKITPTAVSFGDQNSSRGSTETPNN